MEEPHGTMEELRELLWTYNELPEKREEVLSEVDRRFGRRRSVLILDSCGFSRKVHEHGIVSFMAMLERMERVLRPPIEEAGGVVLRREADDIFALFPEPASALQAARDMLAAVRAANEALPMEEEVGISLGIGYGDLLLIGDDDCWGDEMNLASKLGEDLAECGEVLLTEAAHTALTPDLASQFEERTYSVSGLTLEAWRLSG